MKGLSVVIVGGASGLDIIGLNAEAVIDRGGAGPGAGGGPPDQLCRLRHPHRPRRA